MYTQQTAPQKGGFSPVRIAIGVMILVLLCGGSVWGGLRYFGSPNTAASPTAGPAASLPTAASSGGAVAPLPTSASQSAAPTAVSVAPAGGAATTAPAALATSVPVAGGQTTDRPKLRCLVANFPSYYNTALIEERFDEKWGFDLEVLPMASGADGKENDYTEEQQAQMLSEGSVDCLLTTLDTIPLRGDYGQVTLVVDQSRGADLIAAKDPNLKFNDLRGKPIAASRGSISELLTIAVFSALGENPSDPAVRNMLPDVDSAETAVERFQSGDAYAVSAWVPVLNAADDGSVFTYDASGNAVNIGFKVIDSANIPVIADGVIFSHQAIAAKAAAVQGFHNAWFEALNFMLAQPDQAADVIIGWDSRHGDWTGLAQTAQDTGVSTGATLKDYMFGIAQAGLEPNVFLMQDHQTRGGAGVLGSFIGYTGELWKAGGVATQAFDPQRGVNPAFVLSVAQSHPELVTTAQPLYTDKPFILHGTPSLAPVDVTGIDDSQIIASLPRESFEFEPNSGQLKGDSDTRFRSYIALRVQPAMKATSSDVKLICRVGSAWPPGDTAEGLTQFLTNTRIPGIAQFMGVLGVQMNRVGFVPWVPNERDLGGEFAKHQNTSDPAIQAMDRFIQCELAAPGGR